jgi:hypothetical protein
MNQLAYKVVTKIDGKLFSLHTTRIKNNITAVEYKLNEFTYPKIKNSLLMAYTVPTVFEKYQHFELYLCEVEVSKEQPEHILAPVFIECFAEKFWKNFTNNYLTFHQRETPPYTIFCNSIKLLKRIA